MRIAIASDHGGFDYKSSIIDYLKSKGHEVIDCGTSSKESCHYPIFVRKACCLLRHKVVDRIVLVCTTGEGVTMTANRYPHIRCGLAYDDEVTKLMREHNDANAISFGQKFMKLDDVLRRLDIFLNTEFLGGRHLTRVQMIER